MLCSLNGAVLHYESESLFPHTYGRSKEKVLIILGNPATHSVAGGMFFYSKNDGNRHQFWGKLEEAGLMPRIRYNTRAEEGGFQVPDDDNFCADSRISNIQWYGGSNENELHFGMPVKKMAPGRCTK